MVNTVDQDYKNPYFIPTRPILKILHSLIPHPLFSHALFLKSTKYSIFFVMIRELISLLLAYLLVWILIVQVSHHPSLVLYKVSIIFFIF